MQITKVSNLYNVSHGKLATKSQMSCWRKMNNIPEYVNASYTGYTGKKERFFSTIKKDNPDITKQFQRFEEEILQYLKNLRKKPFGYIRALWAMGQNLGTGAPWDTKFLPEFPGRNEIGEPQFAIYKQDFVSGNDISNILYGHICAYMGIPTKIAQFIAKMDACGALELFSKGKFPDKKLISFRDTQNDQLAIRKGVEEFKLSDYKLK